MNREQWLTLPEPVRDFFWDNIETIHQEITAQFGLNQKQLNFIWDLEDLLLLKRTNILDLPQALANLPQAEKVDLRLLSLAIATKLCWPIQDYLGEVDRLILRLGGKVPAPKHFKVKTDQKKVFPEQSTGIVRQLLVEFDDFKELRLSGKKIYGIDGRLLTPTVENWLKDYVHFLGAGYHNSLQRAQYLAKAPNPLELDEVEKESLRNLLISYDDNVNMSWENAEGILRVSPVAKIVAEPQKIDLEAVVKQIQDNLKSIEQLILPEDFVMSEAGNDLFKIRDILLQALGMQDKIKVLSCLKILASHKSLDALFSEDVRFRNLLKRFVTVRYGNALGAWLETNQDKALARRLFLEMVLEEKSRLPEEEATMVALYLTNLWPQSGQVVYLDQADGLLKWRGVQVVKNQLLWI